MYSYTGTLLQKKKYVGGALTFQADYVNGFVYTGNGTTKTLEFFPTEEGRVTYNSGTTAFQYEYFYKDQVGNVRMSFADLNNDGTVATSEILQQTHYYPFGLAFGGMQTPLVGVANKYLFGDQEMHDDVFNGVAFDNYAFEARFYDPQIGRWTTQDPADQFASPYLGIGNNPVNFVDPDGRFTWWDAGSIVSIVAGAALCATGVGSTIGAALIVAGVGHFGNTLDRLDDYNGDWDASSNDAGINISYSFKPGWDKPDKAPKDGFYSSGEIPKNEPHDLTPGTMTAGGDKLLGTKGSQNDPYQYSDGQPVFTLNEFVTANRGKTREQIIKQMNIPSFGHSSQPFGPFMRYVRNPNDNRVIDMRHFLVVGPQGPIVGLAVELWQAGAHDASAMHPQDFYSNDLGFDFNGYQRLYQLRTPTEYTNYLNNFFTTPHYYNK